MKNNKIYITQVGLLFSFRFLQYNLLYNYYKPFWLIITELVFLPRHPIMPPLILKKAMIPIPSTPFQNMMVFTGKPGVNATLNNLQA